MLIAILVLVGIALVAIVVGVVLLKIRSDMLAKTALMGRVETRRAADVGELPPGELVEVVGTLRCDSPLTGEQTGRACAYYASSVTREYDERRRDADGDWRTEQRSETVASNTRSAPFWVEDASGRVRVDPEGAEVDAVKVLDRFEPSDSTGQISLGGIAINLTTDAQTRGYRYTESILELDAPVYVLGAVRQGGEIGAPSGGDGRVIISHRSESALARDWSSQARWLKLAAYGTFALAALLIAIAVVVRVVG